MGVKYCGGCNPQYDRTELLERLAEKLKARVVFVTPGTGKMDALLVLAGCDVACADVTPFIDLPKTWISDPDQAEALIKKSGKE